MQWVLCSVKLSFYSNSLQSLLYRNRHLPDLDLDNCQWRAHERIMWAYKINLYWYKKVTWGGNIVCCRGLINLTSPHLWLSGGTTGCSPECRLRRYCDRTLREATSSDKSSQPAAHQTTPPRQEPAPRQAARPVGGKMQPVGKVETFLEAAKTWAGWTTAWLSSMSSFFYFFTSHERMQMCMLDSFPLQ